MCQTYQLQTIRTHKILRLALDTSETSILSTSWLRLLKKSVAGQPISKAQPIARIRRTDQSW